MPFFSIITCTYNSNKTIDDNILSVFNQSFKDYEHIFIDGLSNDNTITKIKKYSKNNKNIKIYQSPPKGISNAMNIGIKKSTGKYLIFLNSDDLLYDKNVLQNVYNFINKNKNYLWFYGLVNTVDVDKKSLYFYPSKWYQKMFFYPLFRLTFFMNHPGIFYNKKLFLKYGFYDESINSMDYEFAVRIGKRVKAKFMNIKISKFRLGGFSSINSNEIIENNKYIIRKYFKFPNLWIYLQRIYRDKFL